MGVQQRLVGESSVMENRERTLECPAGLLQKIVSDDVDDVRTPVPLERRVATTLCAAKLLPNLNFPNGLFTQPD